ncbi:hypothetical protein RF11_08954 [Thelohanellus kitauei]|uniref:Uncharacterized protein n=1 Tax=Thelohanellus kitauei TaxID=669202 RepID=A0A0C2IBS0_THEKT|nr:hypothetical protein RF11_08954 [Thelohanellus kitauei]
MGPVNNILNIFAQHENSIHYLRECGTLAFSQIFITVAFQISTFHQRLEDVSEKNADSLAPYTAQYFLKNVRMLTYFLLSSANNKKIAMHTGRCISTITPTRSS